MKKLIIFISICFTAIISCCQTENNVTDFNLGFENISDGAKLPDNWRPWAKNITLTIDTQVKHSGKASMLIESFESKTRSSSGACIDSIPALFSGNTIELRGFMKMENVSDGFAGLFMIIYGDGSIPLQSYNMVDKNIHGTRDWTQYSIILPLPKDAKNIYIGPILTGTGKLWVDDFQILIDGVDINLANPKENIVDKSRKDKEFDNGSNLYLKDLTNTQIEDLTILGKVWGFLKYYHPAVAMGKYNWDYELFRIIPKILECKNNQERNNVLSNWVDDLGKIKSGKVNEAINGDIKLKPDLVWIESSGLGEKLASQLNDIKVTERTDINYYVELFPNVGNPKFKHEDSYPKMKYPDAGFRMLSLYRYWNIIQYYFPYKYLIDENWNDVLKEFIPRFINTSDELEYKLTVLSLIAMVHDTHAFIWGNDITLGNYMGQYYAPVKITFVENKAVVTGYYDQALGENSGLKKGDVIETINNKPVDEIVKEKLPITSASNYPTQLREIAKDLLRTNDSLLTIDYKNGNSKITSQIQCFSNDKMSIYKKSNTNDTCFKLITPEIAYLFPGNIKNEYLPEIMPEVLKTKGLIIDLRCYPLESIVSSLSGYLVPDSISFVKASIGSITSPGFFTMKHEPTVGMKNRDFYKGKVVIIVNEVTQSHAEFTAMAFRTAPKAIIIGSTTAGADGNVSEFFLPGDITTAISGVGVYYPDGKETQRIGIVPDIEVKPTIKGISEGKDELLERAIEIINKK